jgi:hypothetical protein
MPTWITAILKPLTGIFAKREERKLVREAAAAKLVQAKQDDYQKLELNKDEWESLQVKGMADSWKDEYVTVSVVSILNIIVVGGVAAAFGHPQILEGIVVSITALESVGVDIGFLLEAAILAGLGLSVWKRV